MVLRAITTVSVSVAGPASYNQTTGIVVNVPGLKHITDVLEARITGGYIAKVTSVGNNGQVTIRVYQVSTTTGLLVEVAAATNLSAETITVVANGI